MSSEFDGSEVHSYEEVIPEGDGERGYTVQYWTDGVLWKELTRQDAVIFVESIKASVGMPDAQPGGVLELNISSRDKIVFVKD